MPDFVKIPAPIGHPTVCWSCHTHADKDGFADRAIEIAHYGRVQTCAQCARDMGRLFDMVPLDQHTRTVAERDELAAKVATLTAELEVERSPAAKVVSLADAMEIFKVIDLDAERKKRRPSAATPRAAA